MAFLVALAVAAVVLAVALEIDDRKQWRRAQEERAERFQETLRSHTLERLYSAGTPHARWMADDLKRKWEVPR